MQIHKLFPVAYFIFIFLFYVTIFPGKAYANAVCDGTSQACVIEMVPWIHTVCTTQGSGIYAVQTCTEVTDTVPRCTIPQQGGGSCKCCYNDGCYLDCPGTNPTGNPDPDPTDPPPPPGATPTDTPTPTIPPSCQNMYYCNTTTYTCQLTSSQYSTTSPYPICGSATPTCAQNLASFLPGQTSGICYTSQFACQMGCIAPPGTVRMRARVVPTGTNTCPLSGSSYASVNVQLFPDGTSKTTSSDGTYTGATWPSSNPGTKSFVDTPPSGYILALACYNTTSQPTDSSGYTASLLTGETLTWELGYTAGVGWFQAQGGDVYAASTLRSYIPSAATGGRYFVGNGSTGGMPGVVTFGSTFDFDNTSANGSGYVSTKNWLANETHLSTDYYSVMYHGFGSPTTADFSGDTTLNAKLTSKADPYYVDGDLTIDTADWLVGNNETVTVLVNGDLNINTRINITGTGFVAFIVNGTITIGSAVGTTATSATPVIEGIYITSPAGAFRTSASTTAAARRFVGKGTFIAGTFTLERDLDADGRNIDYPAELFIYNPELMIRMPDKMKDLPVSWQEVAP